jgi:mono/diheme cytochrome c family protein
MPIEVKAVFQTSCYDCHSNNTNYVGYDYIKPTDKKLNDEQIKTLTNWLKEQE